MATNEREYLVKVNDDYCVDPRDIRGLSVLGPGSTHAIDLDHARLVIKLADGDSVSLCYDSVGVARAAMWAVKAKAREALKADMERAAAQGDADRAEQDAPDA